VDVRRYQQSFGIDLREQHAADLDRFHKAGLLEFDGDLIRLTRTGALLSNEVFAAFV
jgi:coproporphyrinogen III oxidase-like Fe-S oxidoreductase